MPPKSRKQIEQKAKKVVEDKTFGVKNKNRSTKVQKQVEQLERNVRYGDADTRKKMQEQEAKKSAKAAKAQYEAEMAKLFKTTEDKKKKEEEEKRKAAAAAAAEDGEPRLGPDGEYLWTADDFEDVGADELRLEDQLEAEREALKGRTDLTPVTEESFRAWRERKVKEREEAELARIRRAKAAGSGLKGWDLWQENADLFVDDDEANDMYEREEDEEEVAAAAAAAAGDSATAGSPTHVDPMAAE